MIGQGLDWEGKGAEGVVEREDREKERGRGGMKDRVPLFFCFIVKQLNPYDFHYVVNFI